VTNRYWFWLPILGALACKDLSPSEERVVSRWLLCDECQEGELQAVLALGDRGQKAMEKALKNGPPADRRDNMRRKIEATYRRIPNPSTIRQKYLDHYLGNYVATYQSRAAIALRRFNTPTAHAALLDALQHDDRYREDVRRVIGQSAGAVPILVTGDSQHAPLNSVVRVAPTVMVQDSFTNQALSKVRVVFRVDSGGGTLIGPIQFTGTDGKATTRWQMGSADSVNVLRAVVGARVLRFHALAHPIGNRIVFVVQPGAGTRGQPLRPVPRIEVQDAWGDLQANVNQNADVNIPGTTAAMALSIVAGRANLGGLIMTQPGTGLRIRVGSIGLPVAYSAPFNVAP
jgi:hypothetical protein